MKWIFFTSFFLLVVYSPSSFLSSFWYFFLSVFHLTFLWLISLSTFFFFCWEALARPVHINTNAKWHLLLMGPVLPSFLSNQGFNLFQFVIWFIRTGKTGLGFCKKTNIVVLGCAETEISWFSDDKKVGEIIYLSFYWRDYFSFALFLIKSLNSGKKSHDSHWPINRIKK